MDMTKITQRELHHILFLTGVVLSEKKVHLMEDTIKCLTYLIKSLDNIELPDVVSEQLFQSIETIELVLKEENRNIRQK